MGIPEIGWFFEGRSVQMFANGLLDYIARDLHEIALLAGALRHGSMMPRMGTRARVPKNSN